jgi:RecA-family ATPase
VSDGAPEIIAFEQFEAETVALIKPPFRSAFNARWFHEIVGKKPIRNWMVKGLILAGSFGVIFGPPGSGKSFLTTDLMLSCAALDQPGQQETWFGHKLKRFGVIYVIAEGADDFEVRLHAWRVENQIEPDQILPFVFLPTGIDMRSSEADTVKLAAAVKAISAQMLERTGVEVGAVVIDTVARALAGGNENASEVMGAFVINCGKLQAETGAAVIGVHHGGKEAGRGPRGHEGLHGAADFEIEVVPSTAEEPNAWTIRKLKAGPAGATHRFRLKPMSVGQDEDGDAVISCVVLDAEAQRAAQGAA